MRTTNYVNALIGVAEDCKAEVGAVPPEKRPPTVARMQYLLLVGKPCRYTSEEALYAVQAARRRSGGSDGRGESAFFSKGQPCFRSSPLAKTYGWGFRFDDEARGDRRVGVGGLRGVRRRCGAGAPHGDAQCSVALRCGSRRSDAPEPIDPYDLGFRYRVRKTGEAKTHHHGRSTATLRGAAADAFLREVRAERSAEAQLAMVWRTGNYQRGNEREARRHPRNRR